MAQQLHLGARRPVDAVHPLELQQRPVVLADGFPKFLLLVAAVTLRLEVDGFLDLRLHLGFRGAAGSTRAAAALRVALEALPRVLFGFHVSQWKRPERAMVLGHGGVLCRGGAEQRAVHKGRGGWRHGRTRAGRRRLRGRGGKKKKKRGSY